MQWDGGCLPSTRGRVITPRWAVPPAGSWGRRAGRGKDQERSFSEETESLGGVVSVGRGSQTSASCLDLPSSIWGPRSPSDPHGLQGGLFPRYLVTRAPPPHSPP